MCPVPPPQGVLYMARYKEKSEAAHEAGRHLCVGLDPDPAHVLRIENPEEPIPVSAGMITHYAWSVVEATRDVAAAFKPNLAFWMPSLQVPDMALHMLRDLITDLREVNPYAIVILDAKNGDIANTQKRWAEFALWLGADAVTVNPYMGIEDVTSAFTQNDLGCFVLARTSNSGAHELQPKLFESGVSLSEEVARTAAVQGHGLVVGATSTKHLAELSTYVPSAPFLIPGVGAQGGDLEGVVNVMKEHGAPWFVNVGRGIAEASNNPDTWVTDVEAAAHSYARAMGLP